MKTESVTESVESGSAAAFRGAWRVSLSETLTRAAPRRSVRVTQWMKNNWLKQTSDSVKLQEIRWPVHGEKVKLINSRYAVFCTTESASDLSRPWLSGKSSHLSLVR